MSKEKRNTYKIVSNNKVYKMKSIEIHVYLL